MSGPAEDYRALAADDGAAVWAMDDERLLKHWFATRLMIETDAGMPTDARRIRLVLQVERFERAEIRRRMAAALPKPPAEASR